MSRYSIALGSGGAAVLAAFYAVVLIWASGIDHLSSQAGADWPFLVAIIGGFGVEVGMLAELRRRRRNHHLQAVAGTGAGASATGMIACCAHHLADLTPIVGVSGAATFLSSWRTEFMVVGVTINAVGVAVLFRRLRGSYPVAGSRWHAA